MQEMKMGKERVKVSDISDLQERRRLSQKKFTTKDMIEVSPLTKTQTDLFYSYNSGFPLILNMGCAGTGKTFLSLYLAFRDVLGSTPYDRVTLVRSAVPSRDVGFLPGTLEDKMGVYESPYEAICDQIFEYKKNYENLKRLGYIDFMSSSYVRGLTLDNTIIVADECQNYSTQEFNSIMTRVGENSRIIFCGDMAQTDLWYSRKDVSGMNGFIDIAEQMKNAVIHRFEIDDICRSGIIREYLVAKEQMGY